MQSKCWNGELFDIGPCLRCGFDDPNYVCHVYKRGELGTIACDKCGVKDSSPRDAVGNKVNLPTDTLGKFSYAVGEVIKSSHHYSDILKKENLQLKRP